MMKLSQIDKYRWQIPPSGAMKVPGVVYTSAAMLDQLRKEEALQQVANVATLPGIVKASLAMPDIHWGYGFSIGGVAAFDWQSGVVSPGGVGYDINCGVRLAATDLRLEEIKGAVGDLVNGLYRHIPSGVGSTGSLKLTVKEEKKVLRQGSQWAVGRGFGLAEDIERTEDQGCLSAADPEVVSERALARGSNQLGTLGSGNHFIEVGVVDRIFNRDAARAFGLFEGQVTVMLHSGSRGLGYQVCDDFLAAMNRRMKDLEFTLPDRQLACAWIQSDIGRRYLQAMACAANYAWANCCTAVGNHSRRCCTSARRL